MQTVKLDGWKDIASHFSVSERTAQCWAHQSGMPVRRKSGGRKPRVFAFADELDQWERTASQKDTIPKEERIAITVRISKDDRRRMLAHSGSIQRAAAEAINLYLKKVSSESEGHG